MNLHKNKELFADIYVTAAEAMGIRDPGILEKDYFVTLFLKDIFTMQPDVVFKGGTSLSKCHKIIRRFSEDVDLSYTSDSIKLTQGQRKQIKRDIITIIDKNGFSLLNPEQILSQRDYNRYVIDFNSTQNNLPINRNLVVETSFFIKSFPVSVMYASSLIYDFLYERNSTAEIAQYGLEPFQLNVLNLEGTFIDKVFALADYYLNGIVDAHSRHIYDLYKLIPKISFDPLFKDLVGAIRNARQSHAAYLSAQNDVDIVMLLRKIVNEKYYKNDYERVTQALLFEDVTYDEAIEVIGMIIDSNCF